MQKSGSASHLGLNLGIKIGKTFFIEYRQRYNFWDLLGDVGGFHGSMLLIFSVIMGSYNELAFKVDFLASFAASDKEPSAGGSRRTRKYQQSSGSLDRLKAG